MDPDPGGPKPYGSGSVTLLLIFVVENRRVIFHLGGSGSQDFADSNAGGSVGTRNTLCINMQRMNNRLCTYTAENMFCHPCIECLLCFFFIDS
jgi:hypothetical protein